MDRLRRTCAKFGLPVVFFGDESGWNTIGSDTNAQFHFAPRIIESLTTDFVLFTDAADTFVAAGADEIIAKFNAVANGGLLLAAEAGLYPPRLNEEYAERHLRGNAEAATSPWKYPNGGGWMGTPDVLLQCLRHMRNHYHDSEEAQYRWIRCVMDLDIITLDYQCSVFQTMSGPCGDQVISRDGRPFNRLTEQYPCVVHFNGRCGIDGGQDQMMAELGL